MQRDNQPGKQSDKDYQLSKALERTIEGTLKSQAASMRVTPRAIHDYIENFVNSDFFQRIINILKRTIKNDIENVALTTEQRNHLMIQLALKDTPIECVNRLLQLIIMHIKQHPEWIAELNFIPDAQILDHITTLEADFQAYKISKYSPVDDRIYLSNQDSLRRMDSLSRLFNLANSVSVCTAVGVHDDELILSFNASDTLQEDIITQIARQRIHVIQGYFATITKMTVADYHEKQDQINSITADKLGELHPTVIPKHIIMQALDKLAHALVFDDTFDHETKAILLNPSIKFRVLSPCIENNQIKIRSRAFLNAAHNPTIETFNVNVEVKDLHVSRAHAEQMLAYFVFKVKRAQNYSPDKPLQIGLTKLCCQACRHNLKPLAVEVRGTHGEVRQRTINFIINEGFVVEQAETPKRRLTQAPGSPPDSAKKKVIEKQTARTRKRVVYHDGAANDLTDTGNERIANDPVTPSKKLAEGLDKFSIHSRPKGAPPSPEHKEPSSEGSPRKKK